MRSLEVRLKRLEERFRKKSNRVPTQHEYLDASFRQRTRRLHSAFSKLDPDLPSRMLSETELSMLRDDTEEQRRKDEDVEERWQRVHGSPDDSGKANAARLRLRSMERVGGLNNPRPAGVSVPRRIQGRLIRASPWGTGRHVRGAP